MRGVPGPDREVAPRAVPAIVLAGDGRAAKAVYGESKIYLEIAGRPLVAHVVSVLQDVPEVSEIWVVGDAERLNPLLGEGAEPGPRKPLHVVPQLRSIYENGWQTYRRLLPDAGPDGRDPGPADLDLPVLYISGDLPFATPQEISVFVRRALATGASYVVGLVEREALQLFGPGEDGEPGIVPAYFNLREGRFRLSNLHLIRPGRIVKRFYLQEMYEHRYQKEWGNILGLAWQLLSHEAGGLAVVAYYGLAHLAGAANRRGWPRLADWIRSRVPSARIERGCSGLLGASFCFTITEGGGCAIDIDNEFEYDVARERYAQWHEAQRQRVLELYGTLALPAGAKPEDAGER